MEQDQAIHLGGPLPTTSQNEARLSKGGATATKPKQKPVRRDPEKRRLQNIQAQKKYREKLRKRLGDLEALAAKVPQVTKGNPPALEGSSSPEEVDQLSSHQECDDTPSLQPLQASPFANRKDEVDVASSWPHKLSWIESEVDCDPDLFALWDTSTLIDPSHLISPREQDDILESRRHFTSYIDCGCPVRHVEVRSSGMLRTKSLRVLDVAERLKRPDPYANQIWLQKECLIGAMWSNCLQIGLSDLACCEEDSQSPFYRDHNNNNTYNSLEFPSHNNNNNNNNNNNKVGVNDSMVRTVQSIFKTLKPDLRPTKEQITVPHHPFLDILPFPTFRRNLLRSETLIDEDELCLDILHGLICWGSVGVGKRDRNNGTGNSSSGTPWDSRSWEARPWFLRKYWKLFGGEDGELVRQSAWWRSVRGEEEDIWPL